MLNVGLTGGISTGKTTVARLLVEQGAVLIDLDELAHAVQLPETEVWRQIVNDFGEGILNPDKTIDRNKLGTVVFSDPAKLKRLNEIVHPAVFRAWKSRIAGIESVQPDAIVLTDIPLLFEIGAQQRFDLVLAHNRELEGYIEAYTTSEKLVEQSIATAMATLDTIDGLDEIQVFDDASLELEAADTFTGADGGLSSEDVDWDALLDDLPEL